MSRLVKRLGISIGCLALLFGMIILGQIVHVINCSYPIGSRVNVDRENNLIVADGDYDIRILQLSDTQIAALGDSLKAFGYIKRIVEKAKPDLIVLTGDNMMDDSRKGTLMRYVRFFDTFKIPWAPVVGNHDYSNYYMTMEEQSEIYESGKYCLFERGNISESYGNYSYTIARNNKKKIHSLIFMDNAVEFADTHLAWYENTINQITLNNGGEMLTSWTFFHKPLIETYYAYRNASYNKGEIDGERREGVSFLLKDEGFFDKVKEVGSSTALIYGHNHRNNYMVEYEGIKLSFGTKSTRAAYHDVDLIGGNLYILKEDNSFKLERILV